jgi:exopolyphosphatase/guanosine-5'-triphosphate,3'-diphosphate pyrophosphatase
MTRAIACGTGYGCRNKITDHSMAKPSRSRRGKPSGRPGGASKTYAALDLGTNNCRLLIAEKSASGGLRIVDSFSQIVALGEGLAASGQLSELAMARAMDALRKCSDKVKKHRPVRAKFIATQACRQASNGRTFISDVRRRVGLKMETISPKEEAKFALLGSLDLVDPASDFALVIDIGGGSTELSWIDAKSAVARGVKGCALRPPILGWASFPVGVVTLNETFTGEDRYAQMVEHVSAMMKANDAATRFGPLFRAGRGQLIGNSGTVTSLAGVHLGLDRYIRSVVDGVWVDLAALKQTMTRLCEATPEVRAQEPCLTGGRSELMLPGMAILDAIFSIWPSEKLRVGDRGLREGILLSMMHGPDNSGGEQRNRGRRRGAAPKAKPATAGAAE